MPMSVDEGEPLGFCLAKNWRVFLEFPALPTKPGSLAEDVHSRGPDHPEARILARSDGNSLSIYLGSIDKRTFPVVGNVLHS